MTLSKCWYVGGALRDHYYNQTGCNRRKIKDIDVAYEGSYAEMRQFVLNHFDANIVQEDEKFGRLKAGISESKMPEDILVNSYICSNKPPNSNKALTLYVDFVVARSDGFYTDGRHPDSIALASIEEDLDRRDFTMNAMALNMSTGVLLDKHGGCSDIKDGRIVFVGNPIDRMLEDFLRILRAYRFKITLTYDFNRVFMFVSTLTSVLNTHEAVIARGLKTVSDERIYDELVKMFRHNQKDTFQTIVNMPTSISNVILLDNPRINLMPTMKEL